MTTVTLESLPTPSQGHQARNDPQHSNEASAGNSTGASGSMKFFGTAVIVCIALAAIVINARAASAQMVQGSPQWNARVNCAYR